MTAEHYRNVLLKQWRLIIFCSLFLGVGAAIGSLFIPQVYQSTVTIQLVIPSADASLIGSTNNTVLSFQARTDRTNQTEVNLATSDPMLTKVVTRYPGLTAEQLKSEVSARVVENTNLFQITVSDSSSTRAAHLANDLAAVLIAQQAQDTQQVNAQAQQPLLNSLASTQKQIDADTATLHDLQANPSANQQQIQTLQIELSALQSQYNLQQQALVNIQTTEAKTFAFLAVAEAAQPSSKPVHSNQWLIDAAAGLGLGLLLGISLVLLRDRLDSQIRTVPALIELSGWPVLAKVAVPALDDEHPDVSGQDNTQHQDAYKALGQNLAFLGIESPLFTIVVTSSPADSEKSSVVASDLALFLAGSEKRVLLVDANFSGPAQNRRFGIPSEPGLGAAILEFNASHAAEKSLTPYVYRAEGAPPSLRVLPAGPIPPNPRHVLKSQAMKHIFDAFTEVEADVVILAAPPVTGSADSCALAALADGVVVVIDRRQVRKEKLAQMKRSLEEAGAKVLGCVVCSKPGNRSRQVVQRDVLEGAPIK
jgi:capsular exopolysaccharide synthesis family protein